MNPSTIVTRLPIVDVLPLNKRLTDLCEIEWIAGYRLASSFVVSNEIILIFQLRNEPAN